MISVRTGALLSGSRISFCICGLATAKSWACLRASSSGSTINITGGLALRAASMRLARSASAGTACCSWAVLSGVARMPGSSVARDAVLAVVWGDG